MLTEKGIVLDDGVCARSGPEEYWVGTSSANALRIAAWMEEWLQCQFPDLRVVTTDLTSAWATVTVAGPRARWSPLAQRLSDLCRGVLHMHA
jgi:sarcosine oxidase subunit alpha